MIIIVIAKIIFAITRLWLQLLTRTVTALVVAGGDHAARAATQDHYVSQQEPLPACLDGTALAGSAADGCLSTPDILMSLGALENLLILRMSHFSLPEYILGATLSRAKAAHAALLMAAVLSAMPPLLRHVHAECIRQGLQVASLEKLLEYADDGRWSPEELLDMCMVQASLQTTYFCHFRARVAGKVRAISTSAVFA